MLTKCIQVNKYNCREPDAVRPIVCQVQWEQQQRLKLYIVNGTSAIEIPFSVYVSPIVFGIVLANLTPKL